jgi:hypothetical protein
MKRVRYLAGVAGMAPIAAGALVAGATPATAQAVSHGKTVSPHTAPGHQARAIPDLSWSLFCNNNPLKQCRLIKVSEFGCPHIHRWTRPGSVDIRVMVAGVF